MDAADFENVLWRSKCNASKLPMILGFIPLVCFIGIFFAMHFFGFGAVVIIFIILSIGGLIGLIVYGRTHRWYNWQFIFLMTEESLIFTMKNKNSYFY